MPGVDYEFTITVEPCKITDYASSDIVADMSYVIGDFTRSGRRDLKEKLTPGTRYGFF